MTEIWSLSLDRNRPPDGGPHSHIRDGLEEDGMAFEPHMLPLHQSGLPPKLR